MNSDNKKITKKYKESYPISSNGQQCIGPCYHKNTQIIHPISLDEYTHTRNSFCPVHTFVHIDPVTKIQELLNIDKCDNPTVDEQQLDENLQQHSVLPQLNFSSDYFVKIYYNLMSLEDLLKWLDQHKLDPFKTKERVFNTGMETYGNELNILDNRIIFFVNEIMLTYLPKIYRKIKNYIAIENNVVTIVNNNNQDDNSENEIEEIDSKNIKIVIAYIKEKFLGSDHIYQFMTKILRYYKEDMTNRYISEILVNHMIEYIIKRIKITLEQ